MQTTSAWANPIKQASCAIALAFGLLLTVSAAAEALPAAPTVDHACLVTVSTSEPASQYDVWWCVTNRAPSNRPAPAFIRWIAQIAGHMVGRIDGDGAWVVLDDGR